MPVGNALSYHDNFRLALGSYYKGERDRAEACLGDIIKILENSETEEVQIQNILTRLTAHYQR